MSALSLSHFLTVYCLLSLSYFLPGGVFLLSLSQNLTGGMSALSHIYWLVECLLSLTLTDWWNVCSLSHTQNLTVGMSSLSHFLAVGVSALIHLPDLSLCSRRSVPAISCLQQCLLFIYYFCECSPLHTFCQVECLLFHTVFSVWRASAKNFKLVKL